MIFLFMAKHAQFKAKHTSIVSVSDSSGETNQNVQLQPSVGSDVQSQPFDLLTFRFSLFGPLFMAPKGWPFISGWIVKGD